MKNSRQLMTFRIWVTYKWYEYIAEQEAYGITVESTPQEYFNNHKYWLKRQYNLEKKVYG